MGMESMPADAPGKEELAQDKGKNGKPSLYNDQIAQEIIDACRSGFTLEKAGALVGLSQSTIKSWCTRKPDFARRVETARKKHELALLRDIELAGQKSWQAKAWMAERIYLYSVPSARLSVQGNVEHGLSAGLAQILAGSLSKKEKPAQVIDAQAIEEKISLPHSKYNIYCATNEKPVQETSAQAVQVDEPGAPKRRRHVPMRRRSPRKAQALDTTTPPGGPPSPNLKSVTPPSICDTK
jgi:hypothetical protein